MQRQALASWTLFVCLSMLALTWMPRIRHLVSRPCTRRWSRARRRLCACLSLQAQIWTPGEACSSSHRFTWRARYGRTEIARLLIEAGADPTAFARTGFTPLHVAVDNDHEEFVRLLIETGVDPDAHDSASGFTPLALARIRQHFDIWWFLREAAAALDRKRTHLD